MRRLRDKVANLVITTKNHVCGKQLRSFTSFFDSRYPPTKFLSLKKPTVNIRCILCGFPRSGTAWILNVINHSTAQKTAQIQKRTVTPDDGEICLIKVHARNRLVARLKTLLILPRHRFGGKYLYVYRDPRDAIISLYEMYKKSRDTPGLTWEEFVRQSDPIGQYKWEIHDWVLKPHENVMLVRYEDLKEDPVTMFGSIFTYLGIDDPVNREVLGHQVGVADAKERPRATAYGWQNAPPEYRHLIGVINNRLAGEIEALGYEIERPVH
jgi:hypothetical protein